MASFPPVGYEAMIALMALVTCFFASREVGVLGLVALVDEVGEIGGTGVTGETGDTDGENSKLFFVAAMQPERARSSSCARKQQRLPQRKQVFSVQ